MATPINSHNEPPSSGSTNGKEPVGVSETPHSEGEKKEVKGWLRTIATTQKWRDEKAVKAGWKRFIGEYKGNWDFLQASTSIPIIPINLVYAYVKTEIARMSFKDPWITVNAKRVEDLGAAQIAEQIINYTWGELKLKQQIKLALLEALLVGHSWIKVGYAAEFGTVESQPKEEPKRGPGRPSKKFKEVETNQYIKSEEVFAYHVPYDQILFDPSAQWPPEKNARWFAHKWVKPYRAVVQSGIYEHTNDIKVSTTMEDPNNPYETQNDLRDQGKDVRSVTGWEIYDLDHQTITTVSPSCEYKLREIPLSDWLKGGFPFVQVAFNPVPNEPYPLSDIAPHEGQIVELTKLLSVELNHLKRWNRQLLVIDGCMVESEEAKFKDSSDGAIIKVQPVGGKSLSENVIASPYAPVQSDIYGVYTQLFQLWQNIAGQDAASQGGQAKTQTRTLGELRIQLQGGHARNDEKLDVLEDCIAEVARKLLSIMQKKYDLPKIARIVGSKAVKEKILKILPNRPSAQPQTPGQPGQPPQPNPTAQSSYQSDFGFSWTREDILGDMDVDVLAGSTTPMDREAQLQQLEKLFPYLQAVGIQPGSPSSRSFAREFLRLVGMTSLDEVMDLADQTPPQPNPKMMEIQTKVKAKEAETKLKLQGKAAETQMKLKGQAMQQELKLKGMQQDLAAKHAKTQADVQSTIVKSILNQFREPVNAGNGGSNGHAF